MGAVKRQALVACLIVTVAVSATANNFASRIKAEILGDYNFATVVPDNLVQFLFNLAVVVVLMVRRQVHPTQLKYLFRCGGRWAELGAWKFLVLAGVNDVANNVTGLAAQPHLTTFMMSLMDQATTPFTVIFSMLLLKVRYLAEEWVAIVVIMGAAASCVFLANSNGSEDSHFWALFAALTTSFAALSFVLKEITFNGYKIFSARCSGMPQSFRVQLAEEGNLQSRLNDEQTSERSGCSSGAAPDALNVFLVGAFINFVGLLSSVPLALLNHAAVSTGPSWPALVDGLRALVERENALFAWAVYICINTLFNLSLILTTSYGSALLSFLSLKAAVPLTAILSAVPWPVIGAKPLNKAEWMALVVLIVGISGFRVGNMRRERLAAGRVG